jgi:hypothetical protein
VLNALFRDKYGEVSMKRTTAGINYFRLLPNQDAANDENSVLLTRGTQSADTVLTEITADNQNFRNSNEIHEKVFEIELDEPLCTMRDDANLVMVDIPGINEAGAGSKYRNFVAQKWHTFDVVVLVMDGKQGVNTEEQIKMLQFVKENQENAGKFLSSFFLIKWTIRTIVNSQYWWKNPAKSWGACSPSETT